MLVPLVTALLAVRVRSALVRVLLWHIAPSPPDSAPPRLRIPPTVPEDSAITEAVDKYGTDVSRHIPQGRPLPLLVRPVTVHAKRPPPPAPTTLALEDRSVSPRSISPNLNEMGFFPEEDAFSIASGSCTHVSVSPNTSPRSDTQTNPDWYLTEVALPPTTPANLHTATEVFELQSNASNDTYSSWYNLDKS